jgi:hypothetical protein
MVAVDIWFSILMAPAKVLKIEYGIARPQNGRIIASSVLIPGKWRRNTGTPVLPYTIHNTIEHMCKEDGYENPPRDGNCAATVGAPAGEKRRIGAIRVTGRLRVG